MAREHSSANRPSRPTSDGTVYKRRFDRWGLASVADCRRRRSFERQTPDRIRRSDNCPRSSLTLRGQRHQKRGVWNVAYDAFISYSRAADEDLAVALDKGLQQLARPWNKRRALNVFLDLSSMEVSSGLKRSLRNKLAKSDWLVLLLSDEAAESRWVDEELSLWRATKSRDRILLVHTSGVVLWDRDACDFDFERSTAVPQGLRGLYSDQDDVPVWLDLTWTDSPAARDEDLDVRNPRFRDAVATLAAPMHDLPKDELEGEDVRRHRRALRLRRAAVAGLAVLTVAAIGFGSFALLQRNEANSQRELAVARSLAAQAVARLDGRLDVPLLLSVESLNLVRTDEGKSALLAALATSNGIRAYLSMHQSQIRNMRFTADGSQLITASSDGVVATWDLDTIESRPLSALELGLRSDSPVAIGRDGRVAFSVDHSNEDLVTWDPATGEEVLRSDVHRGYVNAMVISPDGSMVATSDQEGMVVIRDATTGEPHIEPFQAHDDFIPAISFSADASQLMTGSGDGTIALWDTSTGDKLATRCSDCQDTGAVALSPDGSMQAWTFRDTPGIIIQGSGVEQKTLPAGQVGTLAFTPDGRYLFAGSGDGGDIQLWETSTLTALTPAVPGHRTHITAVAFSGDGEMMATGSSDGVVVLWSVDELVGSRRSSIGTAVGDDQPETASSIGSVAVWADGSTIVRAVDGAVQLIDSATGGRIAESNFPDDEITVQRVAVSRDGSIIVSHDTTDWIQIWDRRARAVLAEFEVHPFSFIAVSGDGRRIAVQDAELRARVGSLEEMERGTATIIDTEEEHLIDASFDESGTLLLFLTDGGRLRLLDTETNDWVSEPTAELTPGELLYVTDLTIGAEGTIAAAVDNLGFVHTFDMPGLAPLLDPFIAQTEGASAVAVSPDGGLVASGSDSGTVALWDLSNGELIGRVLSGHSTRVAALRFGDDSSTLLSVGQDGRAIRWNLDPSDWLEQACRIANRNLTDRERSQFVGDAEFALTCDAPTSDREGRTGD